MIRQWSLVCPQLLNQGPRCCKPNKDLDAPCLAGIRTPAKNDMFCLAKKGNTKREQFWGRMRMIDVATDPLGVLWANHHLCKCNSSQVSLYQAKRGTPQKRHTHIPKSILSNLVRKRSTQNKKSFVVKVGNLNFSVPPQPRGVTNLSMLPRIPAQGANRVTSFGRRDCFLGMPKYGPKRDFSFPFGVP